MVAAPVPKPSPLPPLPPRDERARAVLDAMPPVVDDGFGLGGIL